MVNATLDGFLNARDTISSNEAKLYFEIDGRNIPMIEASEFSATIKKTKTDVAILGSRWQGKKVVGIAGSGNLTAYTVTSEFLKYGLKYANHGEDIYFDAILIIDDPSSRTGKQVVILHNINLDEIPITDIKAGKDVMSWKTGFSFEGIELIEEFNNIKGEN